MVAEKDLIFSVEPAWVQDIEIAIGRLWGRRMGGTSIFQKAQI
jgi:hypothetical protein